MIHTAIISLTFYISATISATMATPILPSNWRVVGGTNASTGQFPYIISLKANDAFRCGGSIIRPDTIITAAHCVIGPLGPFDPSMLTVAGGSNQLDNDNTTRNIIKITIHPEWNMSSQANDIALVKLEFPFVLSDLIQTVDLDCINDDVPKDCVLAGWGQTSTSGEAPNDLQFIPLKTISLQECIDVWGSQKVFSTQVCTLTREGEGACFGDSGGPLVTGGGSGQDSVKLTGLVSWGSPCAVGYPDVYTSVSWYCDWIKHNID